jgi:NAD+ synthase
MREINGEMTRKVVSAFIRDSVRKNGFENAIVGVSGGLDSAVVLDLTVEALGAEHAIALLMPYRLSSPESLTHGKLICTHLGVTPEVVEISPMVDAYFSAHPGDSRLQLGNKCARERMSILYDFAARRRALVVGTSNKSELLVGYSTQFGDSACAFMPIGDLYKTQIFRLARFLNIPAAIVEKKPSADLWAGQTDEGEMGITYAELDEILWLLVDERRSLEEVEASGFSRRQIEAVMAMVRRTQFKRTMPPILKLQPRTIGLDFRYLRDWGK